MDSFPLGKWLPVMAIALAASACAVSTRSSQGTSETFANTSEASTEFTSSTSPRSSSSDEEEKESRRVRVFTAANFERLRENAALGGGEHLGTLAWLLGVPDSRRGAFFALTKEKFPDLFNTEQTTPDAFLAELRDTLASRPDLTR